jgi:hypothetical protein
MKMRDDVKTQTTMFHVRCERLCGTLVKPVKEECLLHLILFEERFLKLHCITTRCIVTNSEMTMPRTTRSFSPTSSPQRPKTSKASMPTRVGGLPKHYEREAAGNAWMSFLAIRDS